MHTRVDSTPYRISEGKWIQSSESLPRNESIHQTAIREVREETGLAVRPQKVLFVEDLISRRHRIMKIWFLCNLVGRQLIDTQGALEEGITDVAWYRKDALLNEVVYPPALLSYDWEPFAGIIGNPGTWN